MRIEAVTVCVNYGDFLAAVAPHNRPLLDRWVIVADQADEETRAVCRRFSLEYLPIDEFKTDGPFSKGRGINRGLDQLRGDGWCLHLDADIALPADMRQCLDDAQLNEACLYGCDRLNVVGYPAWQTVQAGGLLARRNGFLVNKGQAHTRIGGQVADVGVGYVPIGFFQLWHGSRSHSSLPPRRRYPMVQGTAARTDVQFGLHWDRRDRVLLPELLVFHLESEEAGMGTNWKGRKTARFGPAPRPGKKSVQPTAGY